ncbi:MAG: GEVED domain-containing protein, partial [Bacteroidota bacterium]|nr:GEVED domain-containing protein [Bacteroidota bacterium]
MKRLLLIIVCSVVLGVLSTYAQPTLLEHVGFESGVPSNWTISGNNGDVTDASVYSSGSKSVRLQPSTTSNVILTSPVYNITPNRNVRLEFSHLPLISSVSGVQEGVEVQVKTSSMADWETLSQGGNINNPGDFDRTYGGGEKSFSGKFHFKYYWDNLFPDGTNITYQNVVDYLQDRTNYYYERFVWKNAIFYLTNFLTATDNSFQIRFVLPKRTGSLPSGNVAVGWFIDDVRLFVANVQNEDIRVPQISSKVAYTDQYIYPNCSDIEISFNFTDRNGNLSSVADSLYVEYYVEGNSEMHRVSFTNIASTLYTAYIPYAGVDSVICWRAVIHDHKNNRLTYPFTHDTYFKFKSVIPYHGDTVIKRTGTSQGEMVLKTGSSVCRAKYQMRYKAQELLDAGFGPGVLKGLSINVTQAGAAGSLLPNFKMRIGHIATDATLDSYNPYANVTEVYSNPQLALPGLGWYYFPFYDDTPFIWDGISDIIITTCFDSPSIISSATTKIECISSTGNNTLKTELGTSSSQDACITVWDVNNPTMTLRPNFKFNFENTCFFEYDAGVLGDSLQGIPNAKTCSDTMTNIGFGIANQNYPLKVKLINQGTTTLTSIIVNWMVDDDASTLQTATWTGSLTSGSSTWFTATNNFSLSAGQHTLKVWSAMSDNNTVDWNLQNDTAQFNIIISQGQMSGNYAIGGSVAGIDASRTYATFDDAFMMLINSGVNGAVTFKVKALDTAYSMPLVFPTCVAGVSATNTVTFESADINNPTKFATVAYSSVGDVTSTTEPTFSLQGVKHFRFKNFEIKPTTATSLIELSNTSEDIVLSGIEFKDFDSHISTYNTNATSSYINVSAANNISIDSCTFNFMQASSHPRAIYIKGLSPVNPNTGISITNSNFLLGTRNAIYLEYNTNTTIKGNIFTNGFDESNYESLSEANYTTTAINAEKLRFEANKLTLKGLSALSLSNVNNSRIANNLISINNFSQQAIAAYLGYGVNLVSGSNDTIAYNNVYGRSTYANNRRVVGFNLGMDGQTTANNIVKNNMMVSDGHGFAVLVRPTDANNSSASFSISNNMYYKTPSSQSMPLLSYNGATNTSEQSWKLSTADTFSSYTIDPVFADWNNLYTSIVYPCMKGVTINNITQDYYGNQRPTSNPCIGAREYLAPQSNIHVLATGLTSGNFDGNNSYSSCVFGNDSVFITFVNLSNNTIQSNEGIFKYKVDNNAPVSYTYGGEILPDSTYTIVFPTTFDFSVTNADTYYKLTAWSDVVADTINDNDTAFANINSFAQLPALPTMTTNINYGEQATLSVTSTDSIYWYYSASDDEPFLKSHTFTTQALYQDTAFYFSRKSEIPVVKITALQFVSATEGLTDPMPDWATASNNVYEISNLGSGALDMSGYKFAYVRQAKHGTPTSNVTLSNSMSKTYTFANNFVLQPNTSVWLINKSAPAGNTSTEVLYMGATSSSNVIDTNGAGFILRDASNNVIDALTINYANFNANTSVPANIWSGSVVTPTVTSQINGTSPTSHVAGLIRTDANAQTSSAWQVADANNPMSIGSYNSSLTQYIANECYGEKTTYKVIINDPPANEIVLTDIQLADSTQTEACALGDVSFTIRMLNAGTTPVGSIPLVAELYENNVLINTFTETYTPTLSTDTVTYTLTNTFNLAAPDSNRNFTVVIYSNLSTDTVNYNDTVRIDITSLRTPPAPTVTNANINYAESTTLSAQSTGNNLIVWYSDATSEEPIAYGDYTTPILYATTTYYVSAKQRTDAYTTIGTGTSQTATTTSTTDPGPFNGRKSHIKEQYLYKASELLDAGVEAGNINSIAFNISAVTLGSGQTSAELQNYTLKIGTTTNDVVSTWQNGLTTVYSANTINLTSANVGWYELPFNAPFVWDGESNILVELCFDVPVTTNNVRTYYSSTTYNSSIAYRDNSNDACSWTTSVSSTVKKRPNIKIGTDDFGCESVRVPLNVIVADAPECEVALLAFSSPTTTVMSGMPEDIDILLKNNGTQNLTSATIKLYINDSIIERQWTGSLASGDTLIFPAAIHYFAPGVTTLMAIVEKDCDNIATNDTIRMTINACVGNPDVTTTYTIAHTNGDYSSISEALQALSLSGVCGPIIFDVQSDLPYSDSFTIPFIDGVSEDNFVVFKGEANNKPKIYTDTLSTLGITLEEAEYITFKNMVFTTKTAPTLMQITDAKHITFDSVEFYSETDVNNLVVLSGENQNIDFVNSIFANAKTLLSSTLSTGSFSSNVNVSSSLFSGFTNAVAFSSISDLTLTHNQFRSYASTIIGKAITLRNITGGDSRIEGNDIYFQNSTKVKTGIEIKASNFTDAEPLVVFNNAISIVGNGSSGINSLGIDVDTCSNIAFYFNTVNLASSTNSPSSYAMKVGKGSSEIVVRNNNLDNSAKGFAYYVERATNVSISNNNNYAVNGNKFAYWAGNITDLNALQTANSMDGSSYAEENPFTNDSILSLLYPTNIANGGVSIEGISTDITGYSRPVSPGPTIGAYEMLRNDHDAGVIAIIDPVTTVDYVEGEQIPLTVTIKNFGNYSLTEMSLVARLKYGEYDENVIQTLTEEYSGMLTSMQEVAYTFNGTFTAVLNDPITQPLYIEVYAIVDGDEYSLNDTSKIEVSVIPAYNLQLVKTDAITERCKLLSQPITVQIKNVGVRAIKSTDNVFITYEVEGRPDMTVTEQLTLPYTYGGINYDSIQKNVQIGYTFNQTVNLYPLGNSDTTWKIRSYVSLNEDHVQTNDTSAYITVTSRRSPNPPTALNDTVFYGTIGHPSATQTDHLAIKWFKDSTSTEPFYTASYNNAQGQYIPYTTKDRVFDDSIYYVRVNLTGSYPCESFYTEVKVVVKDRQPVDMAALEVTAPLHTISTTFNQAGAQLSHINTETNSQNASVYMEEDTVKFRVVNYGTQPASNFNLTYSIATSTTADPTLITETCTQTVQPDQEFVYAFSTLADLSDPSKTYRIRAWVDITNDATSLNDTSDYRLVKPLNGNTVYPTPTVTEASSLDITRVQLSNIDNTSVTGDDTYSDYTQSIEPAIMFKGITDTLIVEHQNAASMDFGLNHSGWMKVWIDWNRNGSFEGEDDGVFFTNNYSNWECVYSDTVYKESTTNYIPIKVPEDIQSGKTRMRIILSQEDSKHEFLAGENGMTIDKGEVEDYLLNILPREDNNAQLVRFVSPSSTFQTDEQQSISVRLKNVGNNNITSADIYWSVNGQEQQTYNWTGNLTTSAVADITLGTINIDYGLTDIVAYVDLAGDYYNANDTISTSVFRFRTYEITYEENFDDQVVINDDFHPYEMNPSKPENCWQFGIPDADSNTRITEAYSLPYCWKTNLAGKYPKNNTSILYSPVFDIELIKPDTLSFMLYRAMGAGASMTVEYLDYQGLWQILPGDTINGVPSGNNWYNDIDGFKGNSQAWQKVSYSLAHLVTNMGVTAQFRFKFVSGSSATSDGVAIDDFRLAKGLRDQDAGVTYIELAPSLLPNYGQEFYPRVTVHNYGSGMLSSYKVCYLSEDMHIQTCEDVNYGDNGILPGRDTVYTFQSGHYLNVDMPDPFTIIAFTRLNPVDLYSENDSAWASIVIGPLQKDAAIVAIEQPVEQIVANDDVEIAIRVRNYGLEPIEQLPVSYVITGSSQV